MIIAVPEMLTKPPIVNEAPEVTMLVPDMPIRDVTLADPVETTGAVEATANRVVALADAELTTTAVPVIARLPELITPKDPVALVTAAEDPDTPEAEPKVALPPEAA